MSDHDDLIEDARHVARLTRFQTGLVLRDAETVEREARINEQRRLRDLARRFLIKHGRSMPAPLSPEHSATIIPFPNHRRLA